MTGPRESTLLRALAHALKGATPHSDGSSIVPVSPAVLRFWGEQLEELEQSRGRGAPDKSRLHLSWAVQYWYWRAIAPADIDGAVRNVQKITTTLYPGEPVPTAATIQRVARKHRVDVFALFDANDGYDAEDGPHHPFLEPLREYLRKHERRGRE